MLPQLTAVQSPYVLCSSKLDRLFSKSPQDTWKEKLLWIVISIMDMARLCLSCGSRMVLPYFSSHRSITHFIRITLLILLTLIDTNRAQVNQIELRYSIEEEGPLGAHVGNVKNDSQIFDRYPDPQEQSRLRFQFLKQPRVNFVIDEVSGMLSVSGRVDRDQVCESMSECIIETHIALAPSFEIMKVSVVILDVNDNAPEFDKSQTTQHILESASLGTAFSLPAATDRDSPTYGVTRYSLLPADDHTFKLKVSEKVDGSIDLKLELQSHLNREEKDRYQFHIMAYDGGSPAEVGGMDVFIVVEDTNDNPPSFLASSYNVSVWESAPLGSSILTVEAVDRDLGINGEIEFALSEYDEETYGDIFLVDSESGVIGIRKSLDHETRSSYILTVTARDKGPDSILVECQVQIHVLDENDNAPNISVYTLVDSSTKVAKISENTEVGTFVAHISVADGDSGDNGRVNCSLHSRRFRLVPIDATEFKIITAMRLDRELQQKYSLQLTCTDFGDRPKSSTQQIQVLIEDINDNEPIFSQSVYSAEIIENNYVGHEFVQVNASDADTGPNARLHYSLPDDVKYQFNIDEFTGIISAVRKLDYEELQEETFRVFVRDEGRPPHSSSALVKVKIENINDEPPIFEENIYNFEIFEGKPEQTIVGQVIARDADDGELTSSFTFSLESDHNPMYLSRFSIDPHSGEITTKVVLDGEELSIYYLIAKVSDASRPRDLFSEATVNIHVKDVNDNPPVWQFPLPTNNTIRMSNKVPVDNTIATLRATDRDYNPSDNKLVYSITKGNEQGYFSVDENKGTVNVAQSLKQFSFEFFELYVKVQDKGKPPLSASSQLNIYVNHSLDFLTSPPPSHICAGTNCIIVLSLTCSCVLLSAILCTVILIIRRKERSKKQHKYNCRMEALLKLQGAKEPCLPGHDSPIRSPSFPKTVLSSGEDSCSDCSDKQQRAYMAVDSDPDLTSPFRYCDKTSRQMASPPDRYVTKPCRSITELAAPARANDVQVHHFLDTLPDPERSCDKEDSVHSGEGSNTDSGRGPSEEGEHNRRGQDTLPRPAGSAMRHPGTLPRSMTPHSATPPSTMHPRPQVTFNLPPQQTHFHTFGPPKSPQRASTNQNGGAVPSQYMPNGEVLNSRVPSPPSAESMNMTPQRHYATHSLSRTQPAGYNNSPQYRYINTNARDTTI